MVLTGSFWGGESVMNTKGATGEPHQVDTGDTELQQRNDVLLTTHVQALGDEREGHCGKHRHNGSCTVSLVDNFEATVRSLYDLGHDQVWLQQSHGTHSCLRVADGERVLREHGEKHWSAEDEDELAAYLGG